MESLYDPNEENILHSPIHLVAHLVAVWVHIFFVRGEFYARQLGRAGCYSCTRPVGHSVENHSDFDTFQVSWSTHSGLRCRGSLGNSGALGRGDARAMNPRKRSQGLPARPRWGLPEIRGPVWQSLEYGS